MQGTSAGNRIKETTRTRMKETIRNVRLRRSTRRAYRYVDMRAGLSRQRRDTGPAEVLAADRGGVEGRVEETDSERK
jgi:hypothetical protein